MIKQREIIIPVIVTSLVALGSFFIGSFASDKDLSMLNNKLENVEKYKADKVEVESLKSTLDKVLTGLCIIDEKTCKLKDK